jgi:hypothetical protein
MSTHPCPRLPRTVLLLALSLVITWGCATGAGSSIAHLPQTASTRTAAIVVHNRHWGDMNLYVVVGNGRYRLGAVETHHTRSFQVPAVIPLPSDISLFAAAMVDGESYQSPLISVRRGDTIIFTVDYQPQFSSLLKR